MITQFSQAKKCTFGKKTGVSKKKKSLKWHTFYPNIAILNKPGSLKQREPPIGR